MNGELSADIIGTNPQLPSIVDLNWLHVDPASYDNFPSDNNPVRVVPKLNELWNPQATQCGINLIPNNTVQPLGIRSAEATSNSENLIREAKRAAMSGLVGKKLSDHLRARFSSKEIEASAEDLKKVSQEVGLLGNVYVDASAFVNASDAERFLKQYRTRLARDIVVSSGMENYTHMASVFHKNVVASMEYTQELFDHYKSHLVAAGRIDNDFIIDSKESLRKAFLYNKPAAVEPEKKEGKKPLSSEQIQEGLIDLANEKASKIMDVQSSLDHKKILTVASFVQENLSKGKTLVSVKGMVAQKFLKDEIRTASGALYVIVSNDGLSEDNVKAAIEEGRISEELGKDLIKLGKKHPLKKEAFKTEVKHAPVYEVQKFHSMNTASKNSANMDKFRTASLEALRRGVEPGRIHAKLRQKVTANEASEILNAALNTFNSSPLGVKVNPIKKAEKVIVPDWPTRQTLPDPSTIVPQTQEILDFFKGSSALEIDIDPEPDFQPLDVQGLYNMEGISEVL